MAERLFELGWVNLRLNFRLKGYVSRQYLWTLIQGNGHTTSLPLEVFTQRNFVADFVQLKLNLIFNFLILLFLFFYSLSAIAELKIAF